MREAAAMCFVLSVFLLTSALADPVRYDGDLSLAQAVARVRDAGFDVRLAQADFEGAGAQAASTRALYLPQLSVSETSLKADIPQLGMPVARQTYLSLNASLPLLSANQRLSAQAAALAGSASELSVDESRNDAVYAVIQIYRRAQLATALASARTVALQDQQRHLHNTALRVAGGKTARYVLARDRAAVASAQQDLQNTLAQRDEATNDLKAALDYTIDSNVRVADSPDPVPFALTQTQALARADQSRPAIVGARLQLASARTRLRAARAAYAPAISATGQTYNGSSAPALGPSGYQVGVAASLPLIDGGARSAAVRQASSEVHRAETQLDRARLFAQRDVANAYSELQTASINLRTARTALADAQEQLRIAELREASGKGINLETLDALAVAANARESVLAAIIRYSDAVAGVQHATGDLSIKGVNP